MGLGSKTLHHILFLQQNQSLGGNIHRIEFPECNALFEELKNSEIAEEKLFITQFARAVALPNGYRVKGYLTWSSFHKVYPPSVATLMI